MIYIRTKKLMTAKKLFKFLSLRGQDIFNMSVIFFGQKIFLAGSRSSAGELMIVATNQQPKNAIAIYLRRWEIENLFQGLKSRGFRFEETHLTCLDRIKKLTAVLAIGFVWAHRVGEWLALGKPIRMNKFFRQKRPQNTYFRYGLVYIRNILFQEHIASRTFKKCLNILFAKIAGLWVSFCHIQSYLGPTVGDSVVVPASGGAAAWCLKNCVCA